MRDLCQHCRERMATKSRGLCGPCYQDKDVRDRYAIANSRDERIKAVLMEMTQGERAQALIAEARRIGMAENERDDEAAREFNAGSDARLRGDKCDYEKSAMFKMGWYDVDRHFGVHARWPFMKLPEVKT